MSVSAYLDDKGIEYKKSGAKNVGHDWLGIIECPYCGAGGFHFGINKKNGAFNCWICTEKGTFVKLITEVDKCGFKKAKKIAKKYVADTFFDDAPEKQFVKNILPKEAKDFFPDMHLNYLKERNFNPHFLIKKYRLKAIHNVGRFRFRIIFPIIINRDVVNFVARDVSGKAKSKYLFPNNNDVNTPIGGCLYNFDSLREGGEAIVVEGPFDAMRMGPKTVGTLGKHLTAAQLNLFAEKELERVTVIPDENAEESAERIADQLSGIIDNVELISLPAGDPGDLTVDEVKELRKFIGI